MGNACYCISANGSNGTARIVDWEGNLWSHEIPATAVDLMLDFPGHLVSPADDVRRTRWFHGMRAKEELRPGGVYLLVPMDRVGSRATDGQMEVVEAVFVEREGSRRKGRRSGRVFPAVVGDEEENVAGKGNGKIDA